MTEIQKNKTIHLATDHAGFELKEEIKKWLAGQGIEVVDHGATVYDAEDDFPDFIEKAAEAVANDSASVGIIFGGSGQGEAMSANRKKGVRAAVYYGGEKEIIRLSRSHNNANILSIGARFVDPVEVKEVLQLWLNEPFSGEDKRVRRNSKLDQ